METKMGIKEFLSLILSNILFGQFKIATIIEGETTFLEIDCLLASDVGILLGKGGKNFKMINHVVYLASIKAGVKNIFLKIKNLKTHDEQNT